MPGVLFHHETPTKDYIHGLLKPWVHYIPIREDLMDLRERYEWAESHPNEAREISNRATELIQSLGTVEGFGRVYTEYYEKPIRQVVEAYVPLNQERDGTSSWQELIRRNNAEIDVRPMTKCCGYGEKDDCEEIVGTEAESLSVQRSMEAETAAAGGEEEQEPVEEKFEFEQMKRYSNPKFNKSSSPASQQRLTKNVQQHVVEPDHPRVVYLSPPSDNDSSYPPVKFENEMGEYKEPPTYKELAEVERYDESCVPGRAWHSFNPLNCNAFHEIESGMSVDEGNGNRIKFLDHGGRRDAWELDRIIPQEEETEQIILKTLRWDQPYSENFFDNQRRDALALERLTDSPHVIDVFGYCGMSTLNEFAGNGNLFKYLRDCKDVESTYLLVYARNISIGLADIHEIDIDHPDDDASDYVSPMPPEMPTLLHYDFRHHNMLLTNDGRVKVSDFNIAQLLRWDTSKNETCGYWWYRVCGKTIWGTDRAPEECVEKDERRQSLTHKTEVYHLGALLNFILSGKKYPFVSKFHQDYFVLEGEDDTKYDMLETSQKVKQLILKGDQPPLAREILESSDPAIQALVQARAKAIAYDPEDRLDARGIANILDAAVPPELSQTNQRGTTISAPAQTLRKDRAVSHVSNDEDVAPFPQNDQGLHKLVEFVHIAKTGGTSIEVAASRVGIAWGICKYSKYWTWESRCLPIQPFTKHIKARKMNEWGCGLEAHSWHCPPTNYTSQPGKSIYEGVDTFTVVRDPYKLMIR